MRAREVQNSFKLGNLVVYCAVVYVCLYMCVFEEYFHIIYR